MPDKNRLTFSTMTIGQYIHNLNGRSGAIRGWIEILKDEIKNDSSLAHNEIIQIAFSDIELKTQEILLLTDKFKGYLLNSETVKSEDKKSFLVRDLINQAIKDVDSKKIKIILDIEEMNQSVIATQSLPEVFTNLLDNAVNAIPEKGEITIRGRISADKNKVEIFIIDTGVGIPSDMVDKVFRPYATTKLDGGHGLGLWWSKAYLEHINGNLELLQSETEKGTCFKVTIPTLTIN